MQSQNTFNNYLTETLCVFTHILLFYISHQLTNIKKSQYHLPEDIRSIAICLAISCFTFSIYSTAVKHVKTMHESFIGFTLEFFSLILFQYVMICDDINYDQDKRNAIINEYTDNKINYLIDSYTEYYEILEEAIINQDADLKNNTLKFIDDSFDNLLQKIETRMEEIRDRVKEKPFRIRRNSL